MTISSEESARQAKEFTAWQHSQTRKPHKPSRYDSQAWAIRTKIDAKLAAIRDEKALSDAE